MSVLPKRVLGHALVMMLGTALVVVGACNRLQDREFNSIYRSNPAMQLQPYREGMSLQEVYNTFPPLGEGPARLRVLRANDAAWAARWDLIESAQQSIDISYFILKNDIFGIALLGALLRKAEQGVQVRILLDAYGAKVFRSLDGNDYMDTVVNTPNVQVRMFRPLIDRLMAGLLNMSLSLILASEHDKILIADGKRSIIGGRNIAVEYFAHPEEADMVFDDLDIEILGPGPVAALAAAFEVEYLSHSAKVVRREVIDLQSQRRVLLLAYQAMNEWLLDTADPGSAQGEALTQLRENIPRLADELADMQSIRGGLTEPLEPYLLAETRVLDSQARFQPREDIITQAAQRLLASARDEIFVVSPYFVISREVANTIAQSVRPGVPLTLLTNAPATVESVIAEAFLIQHWDDMLAAIPALRLYGNARPQMVHSKLATFDGVVTLVGTYNLSPLSMGTNSEVVLAVWSPEFADRVTQRARSLLAAGEPGIYRYRIARNADGSLQRTEDGEPIPEFGPLNHVDLQGRLKLKVVLGLLSAAEAVCLSPLY